MNGREETFFSPVFVLYGLEQVLYFRQQSLNPSIICVELSGNAAQFTALA